MGKSDNTSTTGISFLGMLTILFIGLKLTNNIAWSWWLVLSPLWLPLSLVVSGIIIYATIKTLRK